LLQKSILLCAFFLALPHLPAQTAAPTTLTSEQLNALSGEYTDPQEPDTPLSFYPKDGQLFGESERSIPEAFKLISANEFTFREGHVSFLFDTAAKKLTVTPRDEPGVTYIRTGEPVHHLFHHYEVRDEMIPMRDGVKLHIHILTPTDMTGPLPILMTRTPYSVDGFNNSSYPYERPELARAGYIFVGADIRGRFGSDGQFTMVHPLVDHNGPNATDESTDCYDTVDWLVKNLPNNNGRVGVIGTSYPGVLSMMAGIDPHPAVKAISPQAPMIDTWMGDDFFHNGAFRQSYGYDYSMELESSKTSTEVFYRDDVGKDMDGYQYFLKRGSFEQDIKQSGVTKKLPTWQAFLEHTTYDDFWQARAVEHHLDKVTVPTLTVGGYYDQEDMYGPQEEYAKLEPHDSEHKNFLVLGPWRHGSWANPARHLGDLKYGASISNEYRTQIEAKFFAHYLRDEPGFDLEDTASFQTGSNTWKRYAQYPPAEGQPTALSLCGTGKLQISSTCEAGKLTYLSDPANPVPYRHLPVQPTYSHGSKWGTWLVEDQRFVDGRKDVAEWKLPMEKDLTITGEVLADIFASTTGSDGDFVVKLIDEYPNDDPDPTMRGFQLMTNMEIFRGRYRMSFEKPEALKPGEVNEFKWSLHDVDHVFKKGHTLMVEIQSTWFPLYDRNPQTYVPNIMTAKPKAYKAVTINIVNEPKHESKLILPVMPN
jgi:putative CocE/NonD family hydrolase